MDKILSVNIEAIFSDSKKKRGFEKYAEITQMFATMNVAEDKGFQKKYNGFYRVRRNSAWQEVYYDIMEKGREAEPTFEYVLRELYAKTGKVEASFTSKLLHTLNHDMPIWDQFVLQNLDLKVPLCKGEQKIQTVIDIYHQIMQWYEKALISEAIERKILEFDEVFPEYRWFSKTKKLDFLLWQMRD